MPPLMPKSYHEKRMRTAIERANERCPGLLSWSDFRFELEKERSERASRLAKSMLNDEPDEDLALMLEVVGEAEAAERAESVSVTASPVKSKKPGRPKKA